jgi:hypothetical protein
MDKKFENIVQRLAYEKRGIETFKEFQDAVTVKPHLIKRITARNLWYIGVSKGSRLNIVVALARYLKVSVDELAKDLK